MAKRKRNTKPSRAKQPKLPLSGGIKVRKSNVFIDGRYRFNLHEQKILLHVISKIRADDKEFNSYFVSWQELKDISNGSLNTAKKVDESCESLKTKPSKLERTTKNITLAFSLVGQPHLVTAWNSVLTPL